MKRDVYWFYWHICLGLFMGVFCHLPILSSLHQFYGKLPSLGLSLNSKIAYALELVIPGQASSGWGYTGEISHASLRSIW